MKYAIKVINQHVIDCTSIYISGSFGRGEGAVFKYEDMNIINDYDFIVVTNERQKQNREKARNILTKKFGFYVSIACVFPDLSNLNFTTQNDVDILFGSKCLFGKDIFKNYNIECSISKKSAVKLLIARLDTLFEYEVLSNMSSSNSNYDKSKIKMFYNIIKAQKDLLDAWCIFTGIYKTIQSHDVKDKLLNEVLNSNEKAVYETINFDNILSDPTKTKNISILKTRFKRVLIDIIKSIDYMDERICKEMMLKINDYNYLFEPTISFFQSPVGFIQYKRKKMHYLSLYKKAIKRII